jgi:hypothetical protein
VNARRLDPFLLALIAAIVLGLGIPASLALHDAQQPAALCSTDSDCLRLCPPADLECDGGPQS